MATRDEVLGYLDRQLEPSKYKDACPNGLQVHGRQTIDRIATCTSVSEEFFEQAVRAKAHMALVHHGLFWNHDTRVIYPAMGKRLKLLLDNEINLVAYHLPLDANPKFGNNAKLANLLGLVEVDFAFGHYHGTPIGCSGMLEEALDRQELLTKLSEPLGASPELFPFGPAAVSKVGVISGGAGDIPMLLEAVESGCQAFVTGNIFEQSVAVAREIGINVVAIGHYNSEKLGVRAVGDDLSERFGIEVLHMDVPNPI